MIKQPMLVRFANWLIRRYENQQREDASNEPIGLSFGGTPRLRGSTKSSRSNILRDDSTAINFTIHPASGGYVVESSYYDEKMDQNHRSLHIITSQEDFSDELGKAVFMDILKRR